MPEATYLTVEQLGYLHDRQVELFGGLTGIRDLGLLISAAGRPAAAFSGTEAYPTIEEKAAVLCHSLIKNHPFLDGNKRTGISATFLFLRMNGIRLKADADEVFGLALSVATDAMKEPDITAWIIAHRTD